MEDIATRGSGPLLPVLKGAAERHQERVKPSDMSWDDAQAFVNFTVLVYRGAGTASMPQVRREAIPGRRYVVTLSCDHPPFHGQFACRFSRHVPLLAFLPHTTHSRRQRLVEHQPRLSQLRGGGLLSSLLSPPASARGRYGSWLRVVRMAAGGMMGARPGLDGASHPSPRSGASSPSPLARRASSASRCAAQISVHAWCPLRCTCSSGRGGQGSITLFPYPTAGWAG